MCDNEPNLNRINNNAFRINKKKRNDFCVDLRSLLIVLKSISVNMTVCFEFKTKTELIEREFVTSMV